MISKRYWHGKPSETDGIIELTDEAAVNVKAMRGFYKDMAPEWFAGRYVRLAFPTRNPDDPREKGTEYMWVQIVGKCEHGIMGRLASHPKWLCHGEHGEEIHGIMCEQIYEVFAEGEA